MYSAAPVDCRLVARSLHIRPISPLADNSACTPRTCRRRHRLRSRRAPAVSCRARSSTRRTSISGRIAVASSPTSRAPAGPLLDLPALHLDGLQHGRHRGVHVFVICPSATSSRGAEVAFPIRSGHRHAPPMPRWGDCPIEARLYAEGTMCGRFKKLRRPRLSERPCRYGILASMPHQRDTRPAQAQPET
jgi:hypothetical protein